MANNTADINVFRYKTCREQFINRVKCLCMAT